MCWLIARVKFLVFFSFRLFFHTYLNLTTEMDTEAMSFQLRTLDVDNFVFSTDLSDLTDDTNGAGGDEIDWVRETATLIVGYEDGTPMN